MREAVDANARNKLFFTVSPTDATKLVRHVAPYLDERDLSARAAFEAVARTVDHGHDTPPFTLTTAPLPPPIPGRAEFLRAAARARTGLSRTQRERATRHRHLHDALHHDTPGHDAPGHDAFHHDRPCDDRPRPPVDPGPVGRVGHLASDQAGYREAPSRATVRREDDLPPGWIEVGPAAAEQHSQPPAPPSHRPSQHGDQHASHRDEGPGHSPGHPPGHSQATHPATYQWPDE